MDSFTSRKRTYHVGIICALAIEKAAVEAMLDCKYDEFWRAAGDENIYTFGSLSDHNVAIACLPAASMGTTSAATVAKDMMRSFTIRVGLLVGVGGGVWSKSADVRLGDVVVSQPDETHGGVVQWDFGKVEKGGIFRRTRMLNKPPRVLLSALQAVKVKEAMEDNDIPKHLESVHLKFPWSKTNFGHPGIENDLLFDATYDHTGNGSCKACDHSRLVKRRRRKELTPEVHYGIIASGNSVIKDGRTRDSIASKEGILCFEMEAAGLMDTFPCIVIRGICDYSDSHKNKTWQPYAAMAAAAYAKWFLCFVVTNDMYALPKAIMTSYVIPFSLGGVPATSRFVGRSPELEEMERSLLEQQTTRRSVFVIHGLGGMGKTQLAIEYARKHVRRYTAMIWVNGNSRVQALQSLLDFAGRLPPEHRSDRINLLLRTVSDGTDDRHIRIEAIVEELVSWLTLPANRDWLMIFDNVDREYEPGVDDPKGQPFASIVQLLPDGDHGTILMTTRLISLKQKFGVGLRLREMGLEDSKAVIYKNLSTSNDASALITRLKGLPLALAQASAFIEQTGISVDCYTDLYDNKWNELMKLQDGFPLQEFTERSMLTTWTLSYEQVKQHSEASAALLRLWAFLDCSDLWYEIVSSKGDVPQSMQMPEALETPAKNHLELLRAVGILHKFSLIDAKESQGTYSGYVIHSVLHKWCAYLGDKSEYDKLFWVAVLLVRNRIPSARSAMLSSIDRRLLPHVLQLQWWFQQRKLIPHDSLTIEALLDLGAVLIRQRRFKEAQTLLQPALSVAKITLSDTNSITLSAMHHMGWLYAELGNDALATSMYTQALRGKEEFCGADNITTHKTRRNLGQILMKQEKWKEARVLYYDALESMSLQGIPRSTVQCDMLDSLGQVYLKLEEPQIAQEMYNEALSLKEKLLGTGHISTLETVYNLALLHAQKESWDFSITLLQRTLKGQREPDTLGPNHPDTIATMHQLGNALANKGKRIEAKFQLCQALSVREKLFGLDDQRTQDVKHDLDSLMDIGSVPKDSPRSLGHWRPTTRVGNDRYTPRSANSALASPFVMRRSALRSEYRGTPVPETLPMSLAVFAMDIDDSGPPAISEIAGNAILEFEMDDEIQ